MARPFSQGLEYFPVDVDMLDDPKVFELDYLFPKGEGISFLLRIWSNIYSHSYYKEWTKMTHIQFCQNNKFEEDRGEVILKECIRIGLFDLGLYTKLNILTSSSMQERWLKCVRRRLHVILYRDHILLSGRKIADLKVKGIVFYDSENKEIPKAVVTPRAPAAPKKPRNLPAPSAKSNEDPNAYGVAEIKRDIPENYMDASDDIRSNYTEKQYKSYQFFNQMLDKNHPTLRGSIYQISLPQYIVLYKSLKFSTPEISATLTLMAGTGLKGTEQMNARFEQYLGYVRNPSKPKVTANEPKKKTSSSTVLFDGRSK